MSKVRMGLISRKPDWIIDAFRGHWLNHHGPLVKNAPGLVEYWQNHVVDRLQRGIDFARGPWEFDGFSQLWLADTGHPFGAEDLPARIASDAQHFLGQLNILTVEQTTVVAVLDGAARAKAMKRMSVIRRRPGILENDFLAEWRVHADWVRTMPGVMGYRQNAVIARELKKGQPRAVKVGKSFFG